MAKFEKQNPAPTSSKDTRGLKPTPTSPVAERSTLYVIGRWFCSKSVRRAVDLKKQAQKILNHQRDILPPKAVEAVESTCVELRQALRSGAKGDELKKRVDACEEAANKWLKPYPHASVRENIEVVLVAVAVAMAIRTFFLQPFKIPTGSMQPTLWGITQENHIDDSDFKVPSFLGRMWDFWVHGLSYYHVVADADGPLEIGKPVPFLLFNLKQEFSVGGVRRTIWFPVDNLFARAGLGNPGDRTYRNFKRGEELVKLKVRTGDHLFVNRLTYNFRRPKRGEIIVFETSGTNIEIVDPRAKDTCYIKRLVGLGGESVRIGNDRHLIINDTNRLDASTSLFEFVYSFDPRQPPQDSQYSGHLNGVIAANVGRPGLAPKFPDEGARYTVPANHYLAMGDNTMSSSDSRTWGDIPQDKVIGKASFVYWPFNEHFGFGYR
jgi:signal peptidase I